MQYEGEECFVEALHSLVDIARSTDLAQYVGDGWYTSKTKVIDNAIVGLLCRTKQQVKRSVEMKANTNKPKNS